MMTTSIAERLRELRNQKGVNQDVAAEACDISRIALARYETGQRVPRAEIVSRLADYYGVTVDYLLGRDEGPPKNKIEPASESELWEQNATWLTELTPQELQRVLDFVAGLRAGRSVSDFPHK